MKVFYYVGNGVFLFLCEGEWEIKFNGNKKDKCWFCWVDKFYKIRLICYLISYLINYLIILRVGLFFLGGIGVFFMLFVLVFFSEVGLLGWEIFLDVFGCFCCVWVIFFLVVNIVFVLFFFV